MFGFPVSNARCHVMSQPSQIAPEGLGLCYGIARGKPCMSVHTVIYSTVGDSAVATLPNQQHSKAGAAQIPTGGRKQKLVSTQGFVSVPAESARGLGCAGDASATAGARCCVRGLSLRLSYGRSVESVTSGARDGRTSALISAWSRVQTDGKRGRRAAQRAPGMEGCVVGEEDKYATALD